MNTIYRAFVYLLILVSSYSLSEYYMTTTNRGMEEVNMNQLRDGTRLDVQEALWANDVMYMAGCVALVLVGVYIFRREIVLMKKLLLSSLALICLFSTVGCQPFEPQKLEVIQTNEEAFLLPFTGSVDKQSSTNSEKYLAENLVFAKQVRIPQQWIKTSRGPDWLSGSWRDAAMLIKVDKSPVTREWTADPNSGTSNKNEAVWVMTADQVEFSTGWTCTARINGRDNAVKFLHNYPNGTLEQVMDREIRARIQTGFGLEVTDLPMDKLRLDATPHIKKVIEDVTKFFEKRGIEITNLGISGGFIYKNESIMDTLVRVFNVEQEKNIAIAETNAQEERNKKIQFEAEAKAKAILTEKEAEAKGIKAIAEAKLYEIEKAKEDMVSYLKLKQLEISKTQLEKWDGKFPTYFMGANSPNMLLQMPTVGENK